VKPRSAVQTAGTAPKEARNRSAVQTAGTASRFDLPLELNQAVDEALPGPEHGQDRYRLRWAMRVILRWEESEDLHCDRVPKAVRAKLARLLMEHA